MYVTFATWVQTVQENSKYGVVLRDAQSWTKISPQKETQFSRALYLSRLVAIGNACCVNPYSLVAYSTCIAFRYTC